MATIQSKRQKELDFIREDHELTPADLRFLNLFTKNIGLFCKHILNLDILGFQIVTQEFLLNHYFPLMVCSRGYSKSFALGLYSILKCVLSPGSKIVLVSNSFRQSKSIFNEAEMIYDKAPLIKQCSAHPPVKGTDMWELLIGSSRINAYPIGTGDKIRGIRGNAVLVDEAFTVQPDILDTVVRGFAAVSKDPAIQVRELKRKKKMAEMGLITEEEAMQRKSNQIVLSSTATFQFNYLYKVYQQYVNIIENKVIGRDKEVTGSDEFVDYRNYAVMQISYKDIPDGFLDMTQIANARMTLPEIVFNQEYNAQFCADTVGFFKSSLIYKCTPRGIDDAFGVELEGDDNYKYVMGVDAARGAGANFAIVILKMCGNYAKIVNCWTTHSMQFPDSTKKVREFFRKFPIARACFDLGGGGQTIIDLLREPSMIPVGETAIVEIDSEHTGKKLIEGVVFNPTWISEANYGLRSDFEHERVLFPWVPGEDRQSNDPYYVDKVDEVFKDIEAMKHEVCNIEVTSTKMGSLHFDLPEGSPKSARKDRYSALLLAAYAARQVRDRKRVASLAEGGWPTAIIGGR